MLGFSSVFDYARGKADWVARGMPTEPPATFRQRLRALPFFLDNLFPALRKFWIQVSQRRVVAQSLADDLVRLSPTSPMPDLAPTGEKPLGVVLNRDGVLLGALDEAAKSGTLLERMNPAPQTIRPDMTRALAAALLQHHRYLLVTTGDGVYLGRYQPPKAH